MVQPVVHLEDDRTIFILEQWVGVVVVQIYVVQVAHRFITPLQATVEVEVVTQVVDQNPVQVTRKRES
jgi:hypothetical protein